MSAPLKEGPDLSQAARSSSGVGEGAERTFYNVNTPSAHIGRRRAILEKYPEVRNLMGRNPMSAVWIVALVAIQLLASYAAAQGEWWLILIAAFAFGAFVNHALYVLIHECTHNLVFRTAIGNRLAGMVCDFVLVVPSSMSFRKYHLLHHKHLGYRSEEHTLNSSHT